MSVIMFFFYLFTCKLYNPNDSISFITYPASLLSIAITKISSANAIRYPLAINFLSISDVLRTVSNNTQNSIGESTLP